MSFIVAIDGPAGTGKGTITKLLAEKLNLTGKPTVEKFGELVNGIIKELNK